MNSTKFSNARLIAKNPFSNAYNPYYQYTSDLERNTAQLKQKFPLEDIQKIKSLLEQLDNSTEMVTQILEQENVAKGISQKKQSVETKLTASQENTILKHAFLRCYKKLVNVEKSQMEKDAKIQKLEREVEYLRMQNRFLMSQTQGNDMDSNFHIY